MTVPNENEPPITCGEPVIDGDKRSDDDYDRVLDQLHELQRQTLAAIDRCLGPRQEQFLRNLFESRCDIPEQIAPESPFTVSLPLYAEEENIQLDESADALADAIQELRQLMINRLVGFPSITRRLYQLHTVAQTIASHATSYRYGTSVHAADHVWTTALRGYEVGYTPDSDVVHVLDHESQRATDEPGVETFLCGSHTHFSGLDLDHLHSRGQLCHPCAAEFTRRVFTPGGLLLGRVSKPDLTHACHNESCQHADRMSTGDANAGDERLRRLDEALSAVMAVDINDPKRIAACLDELRAKYETGLLEPGQRRKPDTVSGSSRFLTGKEDEEHGPW